MNETLRDQIRGYGYTLRQEDRADATVEKYLHCLTAFAVWLDGGALSREAALAWREHLLAEGRAPATVNACLCALNGFLRFLGREDCRVKLLKLQRRTFRPQARDLTRNDYDRLLQAAHTQGRERLALLLEAICATGVRVSEVPYLTVEAARAGAAEIRLKGKIRTILLPGKLCRKLLKYAQRQKIASGEIFRTASGKSLSRKQIWREMKSLCKMAGVEPSRVFPHNLRHLFATVFYRACRDLVKLADILGHSSVETTRLYLLTTGAEHARCLERLRLVS